MLREYARHHPYWLLDVASDGPTYSIEHGTTRLPEIKDVPYLDCAASQPENKASILLTCVNKHLTRPQAAEIDLKGLPRTLGPVHVTTITGENILAENDESEPNRVVPVTTAEPLQPGKPFRHTFPNASITTVEIDLAK